MANSNINLYHFYRRYKWRDEDFQGWQDGMVDSTRGMFEGLFNGAVLEGFDVTPVTGSLDAIVSVGIASGPTGNLLVNSVAATANFTSDASLPVKSLVVARPLLIENEFITRPTNAFDIVPLKQQQSMEVVVLDGAPSATPAYPSTEANDVVLFGVRLEPAASSIDETKIDFEVRAVPGKNSTEFQQNASKYDDRLRSYIASSTTVGIKPASTVGSRPRLFTIFNGIPFVYPKNVSGDFNETDSFVNLETGAITGGDEISPDFSPTIPSAGNSVVATLSVLSTGTVDVSYGTEGTYEQCFLGIRNQKTTGAGSVNHTNGALFLAFIIVSSLDGSTVSDLHLDDARSPFYLAKENAGIMIQRDLASNVTVPATPIPNTYFHPNLRVPNGLSLTAPSGSFVEAPGVFDVVLGGGFDINDGATFRSY